jgi:hypothetical protein
MLTQEDDVEIHALAKRGWSKSAIARHTGRDRKTVRKYLAGGGERRERAASCLEPFREYLTARFAEDPHVDATVLHRELVAVGFDRFAWIVNIAAVMRSLSSWTIPRERRSSGTGLSCTTRRGMSRRSC